MTDQLDDLGKELVVEARRLLKATTDETRPDVFKAVSTFYLGITKGVRKKDEDGDVISFADIRKKAEGKTK